MFKCRSRVRPWERYKVIVRNCRLSLGCLGSVCILNRGRTASARTPENGNITKIQTYNRKSVKKLTWSVGNREKSSGGFVMTYLLEEASQDELVSLNLKPGGKNQSFRVFCPFRNNYLFPKFQSLSRFRERGRKSIDTQITTPPLCVGNKKTMWNGNGNVQDEKKIFLA